MKTLKLILVSIIATCFPFFGTFIALLLYSSGDKDVKKKVEEMKQKLNQLKQQNHALESENATLKESINKLTPEQSSYMDLTIEINKLKEQKAMLHSRISELSNMQEVKSKELVILEDELLFQEMGLYKPMYEFANSDTYKAELDNIREQQKALIKSDAATEAPTGWTVNGSLSEGKKFIKNASKQLLRTFNTECENAINKVKFNNFDSMKERISKSFAQLNKLNETHQVRITAQYLDLKFKELHLAYEYAQKKQAEKEEQQRIKEQMREEARAQKELEEARKKVQKEQQHYQNQLAQLKERIDNATGDERAELSTKYAELQSQLHTIDEQLQDIDYRQANQKAGYVYVISNIGSFGENVFKIGMTRRLEPQDRVDELGGASVPFKFDVHAMIFAEDAPGLEAALHRAFENKKVNMVNQRKEFFNVSLDEIEDVVKANFDKTVEFTRLAAAEQYRESLKIRENIS